MPACNRMRSSLSLGVHRPPAAPQVEFFAGRLRRLLGDLTFLDAYTRTGACCVLWCLCVAIAVCCPAW